MSDEDKILTRFGTWLEMLGLVIVIGVHASIDGSELPAVCSAAKSLLLSEVEG